MLWARDYRNAVWQLEYGFYRITNCDFDVFLIASELISIRTFTLMHDLAETQRCLRREPAQLRPRRSSAHGFTLVELLVVMIIIGILSAIAAPRLLSTTKNATDNGMKQTLGVVRNAIEMYSADYGGAFPGADGTQTTFYNDLSPYLRTGAPFPSSLVGAKNNSVRMQTTGQSLTADASPTTGWAYDNVSGQFIANSSAPSSDGVTPFSSF